MAFDATSYAMGKAAGGGGGGSGGVTIVEIEFANGIYTAKMKAGEMYAAGQTSVLVLKEVGDSFNGYYVVVKFFLDNGTYVFGCDSSTDISLGANSADDYPTTSDD